MILISQDKKFFLMWSKITKFEIVKYIDKFNENKFGIYANVVHSGDYLIGKFSTHQKALTELHSIISKSTSIKTINVSEFS